MALSQKILLNVRRCAVPFYLAFVASIVLVYLALVCFWLLFFVLFSSYTQLVCRDLRIAYAGVRDLQLCCTCFCARLPSNYEPTLYALQCNEFYVARCP